MTDAIDDHVAKRILLRRKQLHMTQKELARAIEVSSQCVFKYESGEIRLSVSRLWLVARALKVPPSYFLDDIY